MAKWLNGVPVPGVWTKAYNDGSSANAELTKAGHWRAVALTSNGTVFNSAVCADLADAKITAITFHLEDSRKEKRRKRREQ